MASKSRWRIGSLFTLLFVVLMGGRAILAMRTPKPVIPPSLWMTGKDQTGTLSFPESTVTQEERDALRKRLEELSKPLEVPPPNKDAPAPLPPPPPPPPAFRASKPGADASQPLKFPEGVTEPFTPEGFKQHLERALKECPMGAMELISIDCTEFPCMALTELKDETARQANLNACGTWTDVFQHGTQYESSVRKQAGQEAHYMAWVPLPPHTADAKLVMRRSQRRAKAMMKALDTH